MNQWTVGLAAGLPDGGFVRFASEMARTMEDGDNMRLIPMVTRGTTTNIADLLYLRGVDVAITYADALDMYSRQAGLSNINDRIRYIMQFFISDIHIYARDEFKSLEDLKGQKVAVGTSGVAAALTGPLIFKRLGIEIQPVPVGGPIALEKLHKGEVSAMVYVAAKPSELFAGMKPEEGRASCRRTLRSIPLPFPRFWPSTIGSRARIGVSGSIVLSRPCSTTSHVCRSRHFMPNGRTSVLGRRFPAGSAIPLRKRWWNI
jgi:TRAP-type uncharacterized transport system substrate-binding protein